jgi:4-hydroxy-3-methylbut-2-enyl diphosphate reductase
VIDRLKECGAKSVRTLEGVEEHIAFPLPKGLSKFQTTESSRQCNA